MSEILTPAKIEERLYQLSKELDSAHEERIADEKSYYLAKSEFEIGLAKARLVLMNSTVKMNADEKNAQVTVDCEKQVRDMNIADAKLKASRANLERIKVQADIARTLSASVRESSK